MMKGSRTLIVWKLFLMVQAMKKFIKKIEIKSFSSAKCGRSIFLQNDLFQVHVKCYINEKFWRKEITKYIIQIHPKFLIIFNHT